METRLGHGSASSRDARRHGEQARTRPGRAGRATRSVAGGPRAVDRARAGGTPPANARCGRGGLRDGASLAGQAAWLGRWRLGATRRFQSIGSHTKTSHYLLQMLFFLPCALCPANDDSDSSSAQSSVCAVGAVTGRGILVMKP